MMTEFEALPEGVVEVAHIEIRLVEALDGKTFAVQSEHSGSHEQVVYMLENTKYKLMISAL